MRKKSICLRLTLWIACFAILVNALAPSIAQTLSVLRGDSMAWSICSTNNTKNISRVLSRLDARAYANAIKPAEKSKTSTAMDCAYCLPHVDTSTLLSSLMSGLGIFTGHELRPLLFYHAPQPMLALSAARPRGPPADFV